MRLTRKKSLQKYYESRFEEIKAHLVKFFPHEIRTPLTGILGCAEILKEDGDLPAEEVKKIGAAIYKSGQQLRRLLENVILLGELQSWMNDRNAVATMRRDSISSLLEVIRSAAEREAEIQKRTDSISIEVDDSLVQISSMHLTKIMEEVINNALKFSDPGSKIYISSEKNDVKVAITIRDEGRGMTIGQIDKIAAIQQFEASHHDQQGAGIGLTIAKTLTELYGGSLTIESTEKKGTTVKIKLLKLMNA